ncbi:MAG: CoA transferase [Trebonia sp.]|jgi:crotonobetainyl-CoA:carnitine CoA-transferase CaiB-like acyl-CoA transferase
MTLPLEGITVVSVEQAVAAPLATRNLADLGARVIKVEPPGGDFARDYDHVVHGTGAHFTWLNRGKESVAVDLKAGEGRAAVQRLARRADVFVQNLAPGAARRLGLDPAELRADSQRLVTASISGYGTGGPMEQRKAYDMLVQAQAGVISITGTAETAVKTGIPTADIASGMYCAQAVLAALLRRERTGEGATIDVSMLEATVEWMGYALYTQMYTGIQPARMGLSHGSVVPYDSFPTRDGQVLIGVQNDSGWLALVNEVLAAPELAADPRFTTNVLRVRHRGECDAAVAAQTVRWPTAELDARLTAAGVPAAQVNELDQVVKHPQLRSRDRWRTIRTEHAPVEALLPPATFADSEARMGDVPALGQHTRALLIESGLDAAAADDAISRGVARQAPLPEVLGDVGEGTGVADLRRRVAVGQPDRDSQVAGAALAPELNQHPPPRGLGQPEHQTGLEAEGVRIAPLLGHPAAQVAKHRPGTLGAERGRREELEPVGDPRDPVERAWTGQAAGRDRARAHPHRDRPAGARAYPHLVQPEELTVVGDHALGPQAAQQLDLLLEPAAAGRGRHPQGRAFAVVPANGGHQADPATAEQVGLGRLLGRQNRRIQRQQNHGRAQLDALGHPGQEAKQGEGLMPGLVEGEPGRRPGTVSGRGDVPGEPEIVIANLLGRLRVVADLLPGGEVGDVDAYPHRLAMVLAEQR